MDKFITYAVLVILSLACIPNVNADVDFDNFGVKVSDDNIAVGDPLTLKVTFDNPDKTGSVNFDLKIVVDDVTVYRDENHETSFTKGEDKTLTITSDDFPGPDGVNVWSGNLLNRQCGSHSVEVYASGGDLINDFQDSDEFSIGDDDKQLNMEINPPQPLLDNKTTINITKTSGSALSGATVKVTWLDDPDGDSDSEWDASDKKWQSKTDADGKVTFKISDKFDDTASGLFQVDAYSSSYCLLRQTFEVSKNQLNVASRPQSIQSGGSSAICVTDSSGATIYNAQLYISGPSYSKTYYTLSNGCYNLTLNTQGTYTVSASKSGYDSSIGYQMTVSQTSSTTSTSIQTTTSTTSTTLAKAPTEALVLTAPKTAYSGETFEVMVTTVNGQPVSQAKITLSQQDISALTDSSGVARLNIAQSGAYSIRAEKANHLPAADSLEVIDKSTPAQEQGNSQKTNTASGSSDNMLLIGALVGALVTVLVGVVAVLLFVHFSRGPKKESLFEVSDDSKLGEAK